MTEEAWATGIWTGAGLQIRAACNQCELQWSPKGVVCQLEIVGVEDTPSTPTSLSRLTNMCLLVRGWHRVISASFMPPRYFPMPVFPGSSFLAPFHTAPVQRGNILGHDLVLGLVKHLRVWTLTQTLFTVSQLLGCMDYSRWTFCKATLPLVCWA